MISGRKIAEAVNLIDEKYIAEAENYRPSGKEKIIKGNSETECYYDKSFNIDVVDSEYSSRSVIRAVISVAACFTIFAAIGKIALNNSSDNNDNELPVISETVTQDISEQYFPSTESSETMTLVSTYSVALHEPEKSETEDVTTSHASEKEREIFNETEVAAVQPEVTELPQEITSVVSENTEPVTEIISGTEEVQQTTAGEVQPDFKFSQKNNNAFIDLVYVRSDEKVSQTHSHSFSTDGFTVTECKEINAGELFYKITEETTGQVYVMNIIPFEFFQSTGNFENEYRIGSFNPKYEYNLTKLELNGRSACIVDYGDPESLCTLYWDEGCHIVTVVSQLKDSETMISIAENLISE
ncbi:MAG: hypothetical protein Q4D76_03650 [Oscillospiraceae bacterium]|nr:hypothetical protein [Oscillospiraceae bacterium]